MLLVVSHVTFICGYLQFMLFIGFYFTPDYRWCFTNKSYQLIYLVFVQFHKCKEIFCIAEDIVFLLFTVKQKSSAFLFFSCLVDFSLIVWLQLLFSSIRKQCWNEEAKILWSPWPQFVLHC